MLCCSSPISCDHRGRIMIVRRIVLAGRIDADWTKAATIRKSCRKMVAWIFGNPNGDGVIVRVRIPRQSQSSRIHADGFIWKSLEKSADTKKTLFCSWNVHTWQDDGAEGVVAGAEVPRDMTRSYNLHRAYNPISGICRWITE